MKKTTFTFCFSWRRPVGGDSSCSGPGWEPEVTIRDQWSWQTCWSLPRTWSLCWPLKNKHFIRLLSTHYCLPNEWVDCVVGAIFTKILHQRYVLTSCNTWHPICRCSLVFISLSFEEPYLITGLNLILSRIRVKSTDFIEIHTSVWAFIRETCIKTKDHLPI